MAQGLGYYSGALEGKQALHTMALEDQNQALRQQQVGMEQQRLGIQQQEATQSNLYRTMQREQLAKQIEQQDTTENALKTAFSSTIPDRVNQTQEQANAAISTQYINAGRNVLKAGGDAKTALELIKQGQEITNKQTEDTVRNLNIKAAQMKMGNDIFATVKDDDSLKQAIPELAKLGVVVPQQFQEWNPQTKDWIARRAVMSENYQKSIGLQQRQAIIDNQTQNTESLIQNRQMRQQAEVRREKLIQQKIQSARGAGLKSPDKAFQAAELAGMGNDETFDSLSSTDKLQAVNDIYSLAASYLKEGVSDQAVATAMARLEIKHRINPDTGEYKGFKEEGAKGLAAKGATKITSQEDFDKLPSGALFINPADGKPLRKK